METTTKTTEIINEIESLGMTVYLQSFCGKIIVKIAKPNKRKKLGIDMLFNYLMKETQVETALSNFLNQIKEAAAKEDKAAKQIKEFDIKSEFPIGTIMYSSWGYEQTNIDWYKVIGYKGNKSLVFVPIGSILNNYVSNGMAANSFPNIDVIKGPEFTKQVKVKSGYNGEIYTSISLNSYSSLRKASESNLLNGVYCSWYA